ncbi:MAG: glycosyltransferase family 2 protein [Bacteroidales bacterium]
MTTFAAMFLLCIHFAMALYVGGSGMYFLFFALLARRKSRDVRHFSMKMKQVALLIPAYREDGVIVESARKARDHHSLLGSTEVHVIADTLLSSTVDQLHDLGVHVHEVAFEKSTKAKALNKALEGMSRENDYVLVLDADNVLGRGALDEMLSVALGGYAVVQGHRTAKNADTAMAVLDGISEEINNTIFRRGHRGAGLSASLIGSGFLCEFALFRRLMGEIHAVGGFDKELEIRLISGGNTIGYAPDANVLDEKVQDVATFQNQRRRWISAQFVYLGRYFWPALRALVREGNLDLADKVLQFLLPPRILALGVPFGLTLFTGLLAFPGWIPWSVPVTWTALLLLMVVSVGASIPRHLFNKQMWKALGLLPRGFFTMLRALMQVRGANQSFIHTPHGSVR